ncbi:RICIN domain-containing protein [Streptomyces sp. NPDC047061]|uniref:RICIN domain-containing protein n=1 Tax=Streptomyces sp. NPDC047061 TaxID=3154605 RepID=UPI0033F1C974
MSGKNSPRHQPTTGETEPGAAPDPTAGSAPGAGAPAAQAAAAAAPPAGGEPETGPGESETGPGETETGPGETETAARAEAALTARSRPAAETPAEAQAPAARASTTAGADAGTGPETAAGAGPSPEAAPDGRADADTEAETAAGAVAGGGAGEEVLAAPAFGRPSRGLLAGAAIAGALLIGVPFLVSGMLGRSGSDGRTSDRAAEAGTVLNGATTDGGPGAYGSATPDPASSSPTASPSRPAGDGKKNAAKKGAGAAAAGAGAGVVAGSSAQAPKKASSGGSSKKKTTGTKATVTATVTSAPGTTIYSHASNRCIEMVGHKGADGSPLEIWNCNGKNWQKWDFRSDGTIRSMGLCMDVAWGSSQNGAVIQLAVCSGNPAQQFRLNSSNDLVNPQANKCVDVKDEQTGNGTRLQLWDCNGQDNQKWSTR